MDAEHRERVPRPPQPNPRNPPAIGSVHRIHILQLIFFSLFFLAMSGMAQVRSYSHARCMLTAGIGVLFLSVRYQVGFFRRRSAHISGFAQPSASACMQWGESSFGGTRAASLSSLLSCAVPCSLLVAAAVTVNYLPIGQTTTNFGYSQVYEHMQKSCGACRCCRHPRGKTISPGCI